MRKGPLVLLMAAFLLFAVSACGGGGGEDQGGGGGEAEQKEQAKARTLPKPPGAGKSFPTGRYVTKDFDPTLSFSLGKGWTGSLPETHDLITISREDPATKALGILGFTTVRQVFDATQPAQAVKKTKPDDLAAWLQQHPYLDTSEPESVSVGGVEGEQFEAGVSRLPKDKAKFCEAACVPLFALNNKFGFHFYMDESDLLGKVQLIVLDDVKGETVVIYLLSDPQAQLEEFGAKTQEVIDTIEWEGT